MRAGTARTAGCITAALGAAFLVGALALPARSQPALALYGINAAARGVETSFTMVPFAFRPAAQVAIPFARASMSSNPLSLALASQAYPGDLADFLVNENGLVGRALPVKWPTIRAEYPSRQEHRRTFAGVEQGGVRAGAGFLEVTARVDENTASGATKRLVLRPGDAAPMLEIAALTARTESRVTDRAVEQVSIATADGVSILNGLVTIEHVVSTARTTSDGFVGDAQTELVLGRVTVKLGESRYEAVIDDDGIRVRQPGVPREVNQDLDARLQQTLGRAGVEIVSGGSTKISDGAMAEATIGGVVVNWTTFSTPLGELSGSVVIAGGFSNAYAAPPALPAGAPGAPGSTTTGGAGFEEPGFEGSTEVLGAGSVYAAPAPGGFGDRAAGAEGVDAGTAPRAFVPVYLRARMPSQALIVPGGVLLALAAGLILVKGVRREAPGT